MVFDFASEFKKLIDFKPLKWQQRLYAEYLALGKLPAAVDLPTGLGKTSVMAIWYLALKASARLPRRLVYVVDRRAVVDQATTVADEIKERSGDGDLRVSTLRGQHVDNREWLEDPAAPAIIVGTVDMIGSRLLFSGYGVSRKMRPYHAGLLGADTLVVLDESHLVPPFERLLETIETDIAKFGPRDKIGQAIVPPFRLLSLSATGRARRGEVFCLDESKGDLDDDVVKQRLDAKKRLIIKSVLVKKLEESLADEAWELCGKGQRTVRILIYCNSRGIAEKTKKAIQDLAKGDNKQGIPKTDIEEPVLFVGARRVKERTDAENKLKTLGFLAGGDIKVEKPAFLIATSAGEVGVDLDADHMVCDLVQWERMVQRFGRVNRRGDGDAYVTIIDPGPALSQKEKTAIENKEKGIEIEKKDQELIQNYERKFDEWNSSQAPLKRPIEHLSNGETHDVSPGALRKLKLRADADSKLQEEIEAATTSPPLYPVLTRALVDAWSMTSLEKHTGRPEVAPWLRGWIDDDKPQTSVIWRKYLPVRTEGGKASKREIESFFEAAQPHLTEKLETDTWRVSDWIMKRAEFLNAHDGDIDTVAFALAADGGLRKSYRLGDLMEIRSDKKQVEQFQKALAEAILVVDVRLGGLSEGLLDDVASSEGLRVADDDPEWRTNIRFRIYTALANDVADSKNLITHTFAKQRSREGENIDIEYLLIAAATTEESRAVSTREQLLDEHHSWTEQKAFRMAELMGLTGNYENVLTIASRLHDGGKKAARWQRAFNARHDGVYAKTKGPIFQSYLGGYRHEFGSLPYAERDEAFKGLPPDLQDLVLHLIAAHHGRARPVIEIKGCDDAPPSMLEARARDVALRFARLQKHWGPWGLAWWESLLRAADQQASRENDKRGNNHGGS